MEKKISILFTIITIGVLVCGLVFVAGCTNPQPQPNAKVVAKGSMVIMDYTIKLENGTVVDTTFEDVAKANNITKQGYGPLRFFADPSEKRVPQEFILQLLGKANGTHEIIVIQNMYGEANKSLQFIAPYEYRLNLTETLNMSFLSERMENITAGKTFWEQGWNATVVNISDDNSTATIRRYPSVNDTFNMNGFEQVVAAVDEEKGYAIVRVNATDGDRIPLIFQEENQTNQTQSLISASQDIRWATITVNATANRIYIDFNDPLAGKTAAIEYWIREIV